VKESLRYMMTDEDAGAMGMEDGEGDAY